MLRTSGLGPALRLALWALRFGLEELAAGAVEWALDAARREARRTRRRARAARRLAALLADLGGAFAKLGQFLSLRIDRIPGEVRGAFEALRDRVPPLPVETVTQVVESELGPLSLRFASFESRPLGTASIGQVHRARLLDGTPVAVKVQFPWLRRSSAADLRLVRAIFGLVGPGSRAARAPLLREFEAGFCRELDFEHEARAAEEIAANLAAMREVQVPEIHREHSSARVLTMGYVPAVPITDRAGLARLGVEPRAVVEILVRAYAKQVFVDGCFHADPHPGNLFVVDEPRAAVRPRVLFVDFGLSQRLDGRLRAEMRSGLFALLQGDAEAFLAAMRRMDMLEPGREAEVRAALVGMLARIRAEGEAWRLGGGAVLRLKDEAKRLLERTPGLRLPTELLLYAKTLSYLFALAAELDPSVDPMPLALPFLFQFLGGLEAGAAGTGSASAT